MDRELTDCLQTNRHFTYIVHTVYTQCNYSVQTVDRKCTNSGNTVYIHCTESTENLKTKYKKFVQCYLNDGGRHAKYDQSGAS